MPVKLLFHLSQYKVCFEGTKIYERDKHEQLLVNITLKKGGAIKTLIPSFFDNFHASAWNSFIEGGDFVKFDVLVKRRLECGS